ncbi:MAG: hypothetical protein RSD36_14860 [Terrisporobacter sp.]
MKKGIIAITLLLTGALFITPITTNASSAKNDLKPVKVEQIASDEKREHSIDDKEETIQIDDIQLNVENTYKHETNNKPVKEEATKKEDKKEEITKEPVVEEDVVEEDVVEEESGMSKSEVEVVLNQYLNDTQQGDITYTYKGDENTFAAMKEKGIRGYVFLPNAETDMAYLVDKDNGSIYFFHPSGYFEQIK